MEERPPRDMFSWLPVELQLQIIKLCPSPTSLWSVVHASPSMSGVLDRSPLEIVDAVLDLTVPVQIRRLMRAVLRARASSFPASLSEAQTIATIDSSSPSVNGSLSESAQSRVVRSFLATGENIHTWSHACLDYLIRRSLELRPSTLVSFGPGWTPQEQFQGAESHDEHRPRNTGPPSWVEEQRVVKAFWRLQFFLELWSAGTRGRLDEGWPQQDLDILSTSSFGGFYEVFEFEQQQLLTAYDFFLLATGRTTATTATTTTMTTWETSLRDNACGLPIIRKAEETASSPVVSCAEQPSFGFREDIFHQGPKYLDSTPMSYHFQDIMSNRDLKGSPLLGVPFEPYRKFGFAIWDNQRMADLGFREPNSNSIWKNHRFYYFRWRSILTEEELAQRQPSQEMPWSTMQTF